MEKIEAELKYKQLMNSLYDANEDYKPSWAVQPKKDIFQLYRESKDPSGAQVVFTWTLILLVICYFNDFSLKSVICSVFIFIFMNWIVITTEEQDSQSPEQETSKQ